MAGRSSVIARRAFTSSSRKGASRACRSTRRTASTARPATSRIRPRTSTGWCRKAEEAPITPTCSHAARAVLAGALIFASDAALARAETPEPARTRYLEARAAASAGADERASAAFAAVLDASPDNRIVAGQALDHAVTVG